MPLVLYVGMKPPKQSPLRPTKTGRRVHLNQRRKGSIASFAFGYCTGLFWASMTNRVLLVLSGPCLWLCDHNRPVDRSNVITKESLGFATGPADRSNLLAFIDHLSMGPSNHRPTFCRRPLTTHIDNIKNLVRSGIVHVKVVHAEQLQYTQGTNCRTY